MNIVEKLNNYFKELTKTVPNWNNKIFIVDPFNIDSMILHVMYDSMVTELKTVYTSSKGLYINGRSTSGEGRIYLTDFINPDGSKYESLKSKEDRDKYEVKEKERVKQENRYKPKYISNRLVKVGSLIKEREYSRHFKVYMGRVKANDKIKHCYISIPYDCYLGNKDCLDDESIERIQRRIDYTVRTYERDIYKSHYLTLKSSKIRAVKALDRSELIYIVARDYMNEALNKKYSESGYEVLDFSIGKEV